MPSSCALAFLFLIGVSAMARAICFASFFLRLASPEAIPPFLPLFAASSPLWCYGHHAISTASQPIFCRFAAALFSPVPRLLIKIDCAVFACSLPAWLYSLSLQSFQHFFRRFLIVVFFRRTLHKIGFGGILLSSFYYRTKSVFFWRIGC